MHDDTCQNVELEKINYIIVEKSNIVDKKTYEPTVDPDIGCKPRKDINRKNDFDASKGNV